MQLKYAKHGFSNTLSGNLNAKNNQVSKKLLDLQDLDVQMLSPDFLSSKTLKKPFKELGLSLAKTNPHGVGSHLPLPQQSPPPLVFEDTASMKFKQSKYEHQNENKETQYKYVSCQSLDIRPAYRPTDKTLPISVEPLQLKFKDKNSIISALLRKGELNQGANFEIKIIPAAEGTQKLRPAESKLKSLFNKKQKTLTVEAPKKKGRETGSELEIDEEINESIEEDYGNESFQKISGAYQSQIKQSIVASSSQAKGSIRQSMIKEQIPESYRSGVSKSKESVKEEIMQSLRKQSIQEEVYEEIFEEASLSDQISKSKNSKFKKHKEQDKLQLSASASKKFRTKTNTISKSIRFAEELTIQNQVKNTDQKMQQKYEKGDKLAEEIIKQKATLVQLQQKISAMLDSQLKHPKKPAENKNLELFHKFRIQISRLITSENFTSKLRRLTAFLGQPTNPKGDSVSALEDQLLKNVMERIQDLRVSGVTQAELANMKRDYDQKLAHLLKQQQISLRVEMDRKLHEKDLQLKKMIAELERTFKNSVPATYGGRTTPSKQFEGDRVEVDSDFSIQSNQIQWKMDLWEVLPDYEKKKLYEKQGNEIAKFLADALMTEIKGENLDRSADISFEFPDQFNISGTYSSESQQRRSSTNNQRSHESMKPTIDREELRKQVGKTGNEKSEIFPPLPGVRKASNMRQEHFENNIHYLDMPLGKMTESENRETKPVGEVVKILSKYKNLFLKKKNDLIRKLVKTLQTKNKESEPLSGFIYEMRIVNSKQVAEEDEPYVRAYEEDIILELTSIFNNSRNKKGSAIEEEMKKMYDRLVITCQVKTAESSVRSPNQIIPSQVYYDLRMGQEDKKVKDIIVQQICNILATEFAKQMPTRKK